VEMDRTAFPRSRTPLQKDRPRCWRCLLRALLDRHCCGARCIVQYLTAPKLSCEESLPQIECRRDRVGCRSLMPAEGFSQFLSSDDAFLKRQHGLERKREVLAPQIPNQNPIFTAAETNIGDAPIILAAVRHEISIPLIPGPVDRREM
jgi:hypothetical protein